MSNYLPEDILKWLFFTRAESMRYNVLQLGKVATVNDLRSQIYRKVRKKKPDFGEEVQTAALTDKNQA